MDKLMTTKTTDNPSDWNTFTCWAEEPGIQLTAESQSGSVLLIVNDGDTIKAVATITRWRWNQLVAAMTSPESGGEEYSSVGLDFTEPYEP